ncbi:DUF6636 domain-containing protein [Nocardia sp. NPDC051030]|uniref:DUF6636 domain-containing protein n=1 Tax=Nocardia sp. NPDC051030 TaxID=3155162 RepID=UPI00343B8761
MKAKLFAIVSVALMATLTACNDDTVAVPGPSAVTTVAQQGGGGATAPTSLPSRDDATVDARDYQQGDKYYFQSPSGNIMCGFINETGFGTGCQLEKATSVPSQLSGCGTQANREVAAQVVGGKAEFRCMNQGVFVGSPVDGTNRGGGKVLPYGATIIVRGTACTSSTSGVRCDSGGHGFMIAAEAQSLF